MFPHDGSNPEIRVSGVCNGKDSSAVFVWQMRSEADKYISTERLQLKAHLGVTWAVQFPEKVFSMIDEQINSVRWEEYDTLKECFGILNEM